MHMYIFIT